MIFGAVAASTAVIAPPALAGKFRDAVINFVEENYKDDIERMADGALRKLVERVLPVEREIERAPRDLQDHVDDTWGDGEGTRRHTTRCPYCISVAQEVESRAPNLEKVPNRVPRCFMVNGVPYVASDWGTLHRYVNGQTGPAEGYIWFSNGQYIGVGYNGRQFPAQAAC